MQLLKLLTLLASIASLNAYTLVAAHALEGRALEYCALCPDLNGQSLAGQCFKLPSITSCFYLPGWLRCNYDWEGYIHDGSSSGCPKWTKLGGHCDRCLS